MKDFGPETLAITTSSGSFDCPLCGKGATYHKMHVYAAFFVAWIPIVPLRRLGIYRECASCRMTFDARSPEPLAYRAVRRILAYGLFQHSLKQSHAQVRVSTIYEELTGTPLEPGQEHTPQRSEPPTSGGSLRKRLRQEFPYLNARGICLCLYSAFMQIAEDGIFGEREREFLRDVVDGFRIPAGATILMIQNLTSGRIPTPHQRVRETTNHHEKAPVLTS